MQTISKGSDMLRLLIPVVHHEGALKAARHAAFLLAERCVARGELVEVLEPPEQGRMSAFHSPGALRLQQKRAMLRALKQTCAILDDEARAFASQYSPDFREGAMTA
jgi:enoyl-CoA hydratase/carnithine racemase